ncbi:MAG: hypothetical protein METHP_01292 [Methanoregula sp. SKADARSKE-2]|nr:MAG: hypothetical protein METHP_01292 [Methanoregula sp. SKADARSKE-2]
MGKWHGGLIVVLVLFIGSAGCLDAFFERPIPPMTPTLTPLPSTPAAKESTTATFSPADMALQLSDLPDDYFIRDRSATSYDQQTALNRDLGWRQGYFVSFYRMNIDRVDITGITQTLGIYAPENMNKVYSQAKSELLTIGNATELYEIPFPVLGDRSIAIRKKGAENRHDVVTYSVIFTRKNVFEMISMTGTTTDSETLIDVAQRAVAVIR